MNLADTMEQLYNRPLTAEERTVAHRFQDMFEVADGDPLIVVIAMMAKSQMVAETLPDLLLQKAKETIELHQQTLRDQSTLIAKELIVSVGNLAAETAVGRKLRVAWIALAFTGGFILGGLVVRLLLH
ncbi:hypothetical protein RHDC4_02605 [Rhodocyclaceae bacterium]|nr:hypothetical protein RHDC4_02605 [Rhodocyclaceae bacterium]